MKFIRYRHFINNFMTEDEAKAEAAEALIDDIDDNGQPMKVWKQNIRQFTIYKLALSVPAYPMTFCHRIIQT